MKSWMLTLVATAVLSLAFAAHAEEATATVESGSAAVDNMGKRGNIHVVQNGDTLWAISDTYLKTPWVWPAVWQDNADIANPHRIYPGDHIWISSTAMRKVSPEQAIEMVAAEQLAATDRGVGEMPLTEELATPAKGDGLVVLDEVLDDVEVLPIAPAAPVETVRNIVVPGIEGFSYISEDEHDGATSLVASPSMRTWLAQGDPVVLGLGEGETEVGKQYEIFEEADPVRDPQTGRTYGYHVRVLGWAEVTAIHGDSSSAEIRMSTGGIMRGAKVVERRSIPAQVALKAAPADLEGRIIYLPLYRTQVSNMDYVFVDRGAVHGVEVGSEIMVYNAGALKRDTARGVNVRVPAHKVGDLVVISVQSTTSVAYVVESTRELAIGDTVRSSARTHVAVR